MAVEKDIIVVSENIAPATINSTIEDQHLGVLQRDFVSNLQTQSNALLRNIPSDVEIVDLINNWQKTILLHDKDFNLEKLKWTVSSKVAIYIENVFHSEQRYVTHEVIPYTGNERPKEGDENAWDEPAQRPFTHNYKFSWQRGGTGMVVPCSPCGQTGYIVCTKCKGAGSVEVKCSNCSGAGTTRCSACGGSGSITREETQTVHDRDSDRVGHSTTTRSESCRKCGGDGRLTCIKCSGTGRVSERCSTCNSSGKVKCRECDGNGKLFHYDLINGKVTVYQYNLFILPINGINSKWIKQINSKAGLSYTLDISAVDNTELQTLSKEQGAFLAEKREAWVNLISKVEFDYKDEIREVYIIDGQVKANETNYLRNQKKVIIAIAIVVGVILSGALFYYFKTH